MNYNANYMDQYQEYIPNSVKGGKSFFQRRKIMNDAWNMYKPFNHYGISYRYLKNVVKVSTADGRLDYQFFALQSHKPNSYNEWLEILAKDNVINRLRGLAMEMVKRCDQEFNTYISPSEAFEYMRSLYTTRTWAGRQRELTVYDKVLCKMFKPDRVRHGTKEEDVRGVDFVVDLVDSNATLCIQVKSESFLSYNKHKGKQTESLQNLYDHCSLCDSMIPILITYDIKNDIARGYLVKGDNQFEEFKI